MEKSTNNWFERSDIAEDYAKYRPTYNPSMYEDIINNCKEQKGFKCGVAVDVGCGSGQGTFPLAKYFEKIYGVDVSEAQLKWAEEKNIHDNVKFLQGSAEDLSSFENGSVDLVLAGTAIHWFNQEAFFKEAKRILNPRTGHIAVYQYNTGDLNDDIGRGMTRQFFSSILKAQDVADERFGNFMTTLKGLNLPFEQVTVMPDITIQQKRTLKSYVDFLATSSPFNCSIGTVWTKEEAMDKLEMFRKKLDDMYQSWPERDEDTGEPIISVMFPIHVQVGRMKSL